MVHSRSDLISMQLSETKALNFSWFNILEAPLEVLQLSLGHLLHPEHQGQGLQVHLTCLTLIKLILQGKKLTQNFQLALLSLFLEVTPLGVCGLVAGRDIMKPDGDKYACLL